MPRIGLLCAFKNELPKVIPYRKSPHVQTYKIGHCDIGVLVSGVGQRRAATATKRLCAEFNPEHLMVLGVCGGVNPELAVGTLLVADRVHYQDQSASLEGEELEAVQQCLTDASIDYRVGGMQTFDQPVLSRDGVGNDVLGVDMEAYAIVRTAEQHSIPAIIIKAVSDIVPEEAPAILPSVRLLYRFLRKFHIAKRGVNAFAQEYFNSRTP